MPVGYAVTVILITLGLLLSAAPAARRGPGGVISWFLSALANESPSLLFAYLLASTLPALVGGDVWQQGVGPWFAVGCAGFLVAPVLMARSVRARGVLRHALDEGLGPNWRDRAEAASAWRGRLPWLRILVLPVPLLPSGVWSRRRLRYGPHRRHRLDVYGGRQGAPGPRPVLIHLHGGGFRSGRKSVYARPLLHAFARHGWICVSASYRLRPATYSDMLTDAKRVIAWVRQHAAELGADPHHVVLAGSSAGAHLAVTAALTAGDGQFQRGFRDADTSVTAAIGLYGYYGSTDREGPPSRPSAYVRADAPPVMIVHGAQDTFVPPREAARLAAALSACSTSPVVYAELPGAQHTFDLLHSLRFEHVVDALWSFCAWALDRRPVEAPLRRPQERPEQGGKADE
jgi:acetyl esterase/lipase